MLNLNAIFGPCGSILDALGSKNIYPGLEDGKTELERVLDIYNLSKKIKYIYDEDDKLVPIDRIERIGKGICFDHCRYKSKLAEEFNLTCRTFLFVSYIDGKLSDDPLVPGHGHAKSFIFADGKWYLPHTTGENRKQLYCCDADQLDMAIAGSIVTRPKTIMHNGLTHGVTARDISSTVVSDMIKYYNQYSNRATEEVYEVPNVHDKKFDRMTYKQFVEYVVDHCEPYVFDNKVLEMVKKHDPKIKTVLKEVA